MAKPVSDKQRTVTADELQVIEAPKPTVTWFPLSHHHVTQSVETRLIEAGFVIERRSYALSRNDARFCGILDLSTVLVPDVTCVIGVLNSTDKSLPIGLCRGERVKACDNLAFTSEVAITYKHTAFAETRYLETLAAAVRALPRLCKSQAERIERLQKAEIDDTTAESLMLRAYEGDLISHRVLPRVIAEWRNPSFQEFGAPTYWGLLNAFTYALSSLQKTNVQRFVRLTIQLSDLVGQAAGEPAQEPILRPARRPVRSRR